MKLYSSVRSLTLGSTAVSVGLLALVLICPSIRLVSQSLRSKVYRIDNVHVINKFNSMSLVHEMKVSHSHDENDVRDARKSKLSDTSLSSEREDIKSFGPPEMVGLLVATSHPLDDGNAASDSSVSNDPVSAESTGTTQIYLVSDISVICTMGNGCMTRLDPCIRTIHALFCHRCRIAREMVDRTRNMKIGVGNLHVVMSLGFDARKFLELMKGKTIAYIGDSVARNQMESLLCILWQVEVPKNRGNRRMQRYIFRSTSTKIIRIWSSCLVHKTSDHFDYAPKGLDKLHLDVPSKRFMHLIPKFDVIVISSGHWFTNRSAYILNNEIVGGQLWRPHKSRINKINNVEAYGISVETVLTSLATHPNYTGLTILRSYSPDHYENGAWNIGGSCTGKLKPAGEVVENGFTDSMYDKQVMAFTHAMKKKTNKSRLRLMDITQAFKYRSDGHPGPYRSLDPYKITERGLDGRPPPQDCLHWCMPGPIDTWNELMFEEIRKEFKGGKEGS